MCSTRRIRNVQRIVDFKVIKGVAIYYLHNVFPRTRSSRNEDFGA